MLDLDQYMNNSVKIKLFGKEYDVFEPTVGMILEMDQLEADLSEDNVYEKRIDACLLLINHNRQGREFTADEIKKLPLEAVIRLIAEVSALRLRYRPKLRIPVPEGEIGKAICEKYFPTENWERAYSLKTGIIKRISQYTGLNFREVLELPYSFYLLLNRESWIASYQSSEAGREILKNLWRLQQTEADEVAIHKFAEGRRKWQEA